MSHVLSGVPVRIPWFTSTYLWTNIVTEKSNWSQHRIWERLAVIPKMLHMQAHMPLNLTNFHIRTLYRYIILPFQEENLQVCLLFHLLYYLPSRLQCWTARSFSRLSSSHRLIHMKPWNWKRRNNFQQIHQRTVSPSSTLYIRVKNWYSTLRAFASWNEIFYRQ